MDEIFPRMETERLVLRQITMNDLGSVFKGLSHPDVIKYYGVSFDSLEATKEQIVWYRDLEDNGTGLWWAICSKRDNTFLGAAGLNNADLKNRKAEIGFWLLPENWGNGVMKDVVPLVCKYGFNNFNLHRIEVFVEPENYNCKNLLSKLNFNYEGIMKDCEFKNRKYISLEIYALIKNIAQIQL